MASGEIIREYLISLGYDPDEAGMKRFQEHIKKTEKVVIDLGSAFAKAVVGIAAGVEEVSQQLEDLYYVAQRSHSAVSGLMAVRYAASQVGVGTDGITHAVEGLKRAMNLNPGIEGLMNQLGVQTRTANGQLRDTTQLMDQVVGRLAQMGGPGTPGFAVASRFAQLMGMDPDTLLMLEKNRAEYVSAQEDYQKRLSSSGINADDLAGEAHQFQVNLRRLMSDLDIFGLHIEHDFVEPFGWLLEKGDDIVQAINNIDGAMGVAVRTALAMGAALGGWAALKGVLRMAGRVVGLGGAAKVAEAAAGAAGGAAAEGAAGATAAGGIYSSIWGAGAAAGGAAAATARGGLLARLLGRGLALGTRFSPAGVAAGIMLDSSSTNTGEDAVLKRHGVTAAIRKHDQAMGAAHAVAFFESKGWSREQAIGIAANLMGESGFGTTKQGDYVNGKAQAYGIAQWHKDRQAQFAKVFGHDIQHSTYDEQLAFVDWELNHTFRSAGNRLRGAANHGEATGIVTRGYEIPHDPFTQTYVRRGYADSIAHSITNNYNVTINGVSDPHKAASEVRREIDRANASNTRNLKSPVQ